MNKDLIQEVTQSCLLTRARKISRVLTSLYDERLRPFGINAPQFTLLVMISRLGPVSRAELGRHNHQDRSTLTRNLQLVQAEGWIEEIEHAEGGRRRPIVLSQAGHQLLTRAGPAWREAQAEASKLLGHEGASAVRTIADTLPMQAA
jgi:DNA-binding MarR family transcriptional regulator